MKQFLLSAVVYALMTALSFAADPTAREIVEQFKADDVAINEQARELFAESRETREERMAWWQEARFGMFVHYGVYADLAGAWKGEVVRGYASHIMRALGITKAEYLEEVVSKFNPEQFDADAWIRLCKATGMKYFVITAKHHDGFAMWHSDYPYNIVDQTPFGRDILKELRDACERHGIRFGVYYSHAQDWHHEGGQRNRADYPDHPIARGQWHRQDKYIPHLVKTRQYVDEKAIPQLEELITELKPEIIWFDTASWLPGYELNRIYVRARELDPDVIISHRVGRALGDYQSTCDKPVDFPPIDNPYWEAIPTMNESYGFNPYDDTYKPPSHFITLLTKCVSKGGNLLLNVGPKGDGTISDADTRILRGIGAWMDVNSAAIYGCGEASMPMQGWGYVTQGIREDNSNEIYLLINRWPNDNKLIVHGLKSIPETTVALAQTDLKLPVEMTGDRAITIHLPEQPFDETMSVIRLKYSQTPDTEKGSRRILTNIDANEIHVFYSDDRSETIENGQGAKGDNTVFGWTSPSDYMSWDVYSAEPHRYKIEILHYAKNPSFRHSRQSKISQTPVGEALSFDLGGTVLKAAHAGGSNGDDDGNTEGDHSDGDSKYVDLLTTDFGEVLLPAGEHELTLRVSHFPKGTGFFPHKIRLIPLK